MGTVFQASFAGACYAVPAVAPKVPWLAHGTCARLGPHRHSHSWTPRDGLDILVIPVLGHHSSPARASYSHYRHTLAKNCSRLKRSIGSRPKRTDYTMRSSLRLLARYLEPGIPTGLTGLRTHAAPRSTLLSVYRTTLDKLQTFPESSLYRQSVEALTKQRLSFVERVVPPGYEEWESRARKVLADNPDKFSLAGDELSSEGMRTVHIGGKTYLTPEKRPQRDVRAEEWDGEGDQGAVPEGQRLATEKAELVRSEKAKAEEKTPVAGLENEPQLTADQ